MYSPIRTVVTFKSQAFNTAEQKSYFINASCFGDDLAKWLIQELGKRGIKTDDEPGQEDFGWYLNFEIGGTASTFIVGYRPGDKNNAGTWIGWLERNRGFISSLLGRRETDIDLAAAEILHEILSNAPAIQDVRWHWKQDFDRGREELGKQTPL
jgi:hypothetical protein